MQASGLGVCGYVVSLTKMGTIRRGGLFTARWWQRWYRRKYCLGFCCVGVCFNYLRGRRTETGRGRHTWHPLVHSPDACSGPGWARPEPGTQSRVHGRNELLEWLCGAFSGVQQQKAGTGSEWSLDLNLGILV